MRLVAMMTENALVVVHETMGTGNARNQAESI
jgi:hypothetical protein